MGSIEQSGSRAARWRWVLTGLAAMLIACVASVARAQTVSYDAPTVNRTPSGSTDVRQSNSATVYYISHDDCVNDQAFVFPMSVSAPTELEVFASSTADCSTPSSRGVMGTAGGPGGCTFITSYACSTSTCNLTLHARELVYDVLQTDCDGNPSSSAGSTLGVGGAGGSSASSATTTSSGAVAAAGVPLTVFFTFPTNTDTSCLDGVSGTGGGGTTGVTPGICASWSTTALLVPPAPPTGVTLDNGEGELLVGLPASPTLTNGGGYYVFCAPDTDTSSATGAGTGASNTGAGGTATGGTGGVGGSAASTNECSAGTTFPVTTPDISSPYVCAGPIGYPGQLRITKLGNGVPLVDNVRYVVAVASYDEVYNVGPLSTLLCDSPQQTNTILNQYCSDGGAGCAGCWSANVGASNPVGPVLVLAALGGVAVVVRRDRRRKRLRPGGRAP